MQKPRDITSDYDTKPMRIFSSPRGALAHIMTASGMKARTKHIDVCYHNSRNLLAQVIVQYDCVNTDDNSADLLTKGLAKGSTRVSRKPWAYGILRLE